LGVVAQDTFIFNASVRDNIAIGRLEATEAEIVAAAQAAGAHEFITQLVSGYDTIVGDRGYRLSGGQRQRIAIARAVLRRPDILVLDEATSSLDSQSERAILEAIEGLRVGHTVLAVAHRLSTVAMADQILVLKDGRLIERGNHPELLALNGLYARLWSIQTRAADPGDGVSAVATSGGMSVGTER
ncbi:MAG: ATP-binding cassette domain-containing protein, partial [Chloroflexi bacterium]|nr:ATP-binding cassette domain-containing protein [Chloroflexota bacterium]